MISRTKNSLNLKHSNNKCEFILLVFVLVLLSWILPIRPKNQASAYVRPLTNIPASTTLGRSERSQPHHDRYPASSPMSSLRNSIWGHDQKKEIRKIFHIPTELLALMMSSSTESTTRSSHTWATHNNDTPNVGDDNPADRKYNEEKKPPTMILKDDDSYKKDGTDDSLFSSDIWDEYESTVRQVMSGGRIMSSKGSSKKMKDADMTRAVQFILSNSKIDYDDEYELLQCSSPSSSSNMSPPATAGTDNNEKKRNELVRKAIIERNRDFMERHNWTSLHMTYAANVLNYMGSHCANPKMRTTSRPILVAFHKMKQIGMIPRENTISAYMYVLGCTNSISGSESTDNNFEKTRNDALAELATFHDLLFPPNEKTVTLRIKSSIANGDVEGAERILKSWPEEKDGESKRLRTFLPLLEHYSAFRDAGSIVRVFRQMKDSPGVYLDVHAYTLVIGTLAQCGSFRTDSSPIDGATTVGGFTSSHGPRLFDEIATEMAKDLMEITEVSAQAIVKSFQLGFNNTESISGRKDLDEYFETVDHKKVTADAEHVEIPLLTAVADPTDVDGVLLGRVKVNDTAAMCPATLSKLRLFALNDAQRQHVRDTLLEMATVQYQEFLAAVKQKKLQETNRDPEYAKKQLSQYLAWLESRDGEPFTAFVDGANVAYFGHQKVHYSQVKLIVEKLERMGETPLVIMPEKYVARKFRVYRYRQELAPKEIEVMEDLLASGKMYKVPAFCHDDYYWMMASVSNQTAATQHSDVWVATNNDSGRFPGLRPLLISNDQMRDHKLDLLEPREFRRWCSCHMVNYHISQYIEDEWCERDVELFPADFFSREIQGNQHGISQGIVWHIPVTEWEAPESLCIWIKQ